MEDDPKYKLPEEGVLEFDFFELKRLPTEEHVVKEEVVPHLCKARTCQK